GLTADEAIAVFAAAWEISDEDAQVILTDAWTRTLRVEWGGPNLEGWIATGTYATADFESPEQMAQAMIWTTAERLQAAGVDEDRWLEVLTRASLVELQTSSVSEMDYVAAVISNRLNEGMLLELDSTVRFATDGYIASVTDADRAV